MQVKRSGLWNVIQSTIEGGIKKSKGNGERGKDQTAEHADYFTSGHL